MGDVLSLIEKAQETFDLEKAKEMEQKLRSASFTLDDFREQLQQIRKMGPLDQILKMIPGVSKLKGLDNVQMDEKRLARIEAIISSMTKEERANPSIMNASRRRRVAMGSGVTVREVNQVLNQFEQMQQMMKRFAGFGKRMGRKGALSALKSLDGLGDLAGGGWNPSTPGGSVSTRRHRKKKKR
jgi:signal recognition particle subunit SRP54